MRFLGLGLQVPKAFEMMFPELEGGRKTLGREKHTVASVDKLGVDAFGDGKFGIRK